MDSFFDNLHVAIVPSPGMGHLIPVLVLANRLAAHHKVRVTVFQVTAAASPPESKLLNVHLHQLVQIVSLPPIDISHLINPSTHIVTQLCLILREAPPLVRPAIAAMDPRPTAIFVDHFATDMLSVALEFNMAKYVYIPSTAEFTALTLYLPFLDEEIEGEYLGREEPIRIPGCRPVQPADLVDPMMDRSDPQYGEYLRMARRISLFDGVLINSWKELDPKTLQAFVENEALGSVVKIPVHPIGPLTRAAESKNSSDSNAELVAWLDRQPVESVIFVSFGSAGMLSRQQMIELAWGLEMSGQRFVWVVRPPTDGRVDEAFFKLTNTSDDTPNYLPDGFVTRVRNVGFLVPRWAQQVEILNHPAVGGFLSHCGWNSTSESIISGVPMIAWPLYAEQKMNAAFLVEVGVAFRPSRKEVVGREEIERMVRRLMGEKEGQSLREKVKMLKMSGMEALKIGGSSHKSMCEVLGKIASK